MLLLGILSAQFCVLTIVCWWVCRLPCLVLVSSTIDLSALSYEGAVIQALMIGGCNSSRCSLVGAVVAAMQGQQSIPKAWIDKVERGAEILAAVEHLA